MKNFIVKISFIFAFFLVFLFALEINAQTDTVPPSTPGNLSAAAISQSRIDVTWSASVDNVEVAGYRVWRDGKQIATTTYRFYNDEGLSPLTLYTYAVDAYDPSGNISLKSVPVSASTPSSQEPEEISVQELFMQLPLETFRVELFPDYPTANTKITAEVKSNNFDVNRANITWNLNGKRAGTGKTFSFVTGEIGAWISLQVSVITPAARTLNWSYSFRVAETDLLWETQTYVPAEYRGKALAVPTTKIKTTAVPWGFTSNESNLIYEWKRNGKNLPDQSGKGRKTLAFFASELNNFETIEARVSNFDGSIFAHNKIEIRISEPKLLFYEEHPLEGVQYQKELSGIFNLIKPELILRAEPYFFNKRGLSALSFNWRINDKQVEIPLKANVLPLAAPKETKEGVSIVKLAVKNLENLIEFAEKALQININYE
jgi:hypothetical protein